MGIESKKIELNDEQRQALSALADQTGRPWSELVDEMLRRMAESAPPSTNGRSAESALDAFRRIGAVGCVTGTPRDLSTNPNYLEDFGKDE